MAYLLTPQAERDLEDIWRFGADNWSVERADLYIDELISVFELINIMPNMAAVRPMFHPPVQIHAHKNHVIIYHQYNDDVVIIRVLNGKQDWLTLLKALDS